MKITEKELRKIVREEMKKIVNESRKYSQRRLVEDKTDQVVRGLGDEFRDFADELEDALASAEKEANRKNEAGVLTTASLAAAVPAILKLIAKLGKKAGKYVRKALGKPPNDQSAYQKWMQGLGDIADDLHHHYMKPIDAAVSKFVDDEKRAHQIAEHLFHLVVAILLVASGATALKAFSADKLKMGILETALSAVKSDELRSYVSQLFGAG